MNASQETLATRDRTNLANTGPFSPTNKNWSRSIAYKGQKHLLSMQRENLTLTTLPQESPKPLYHMPSQSQAIILQAVVCKLTILIMSMLRKWHYTMVCGSNMAPSLWIIVEASNGTSNLDIRGWANNNNFIRLESIHENVVSPYLLMIFEYVKAYFFLYKCIYHMCS